MAAPDDDWSAPVAAPDNGADDWGTPVHAAPAPPQKPPVDPGILAQTLPAATEVVTGGIPFVAGLTNPVLGTAQFYNTVAPAIGTPQIPESVMGAIGPTEHGLNQVAGLAGLNPEDTPAPTAAERAYREAVTMGLSAAIPFGGEEAAGARILKGLVGGLASGAAGSGASELVSDKYKPLVNYAVTGATGIGLGAAMHGLGPTAKTPAETELNDLANPQATAPAPPPQQAPAPDAVIGLKFPNAPSQRAVVDHYFDRGNSVRLRFDNGQVGDFLTTDVVRDLTQAPAPMQETPAPVPHGEPVGERPVFEEDDWSAPVKAVPALPAAPVLDPEGLKALDHAQSLERTALNPTLNLTGSSRQDMLTEAARLRRQFGMAPDAAGAEPYRHPLANEPAAGLGELANARLRNPGLYAEPPEAPPPATEPAPEEAPPAPASQYEQDRAGLAAMAAQRGITAEPDLAPPSDIDHALADVRFWKAPPKPGFSLFDYIRAKGGIKTDPEVQALLQDYRNPPFKKRLMSPTGKPADDIRGALQEEGWFGHYDQNFPDSEALGSDIQDFYDLIDKEARGERVYHPDDPDAHNADIHRMLDREMDAAGVSPFDKPTDAARKLADFRKSVWAGDLIRPEEEGMDRDLDGLPPEDHERIIEHGYEPGADYGIEDEGAPQPDRPESGDVGPRDFAPVEGEDQGGYPQAGDIGEPHGHPEQGELAPTELAPREPVQPDLSPDLGAETDAERRAREGRKVIQESQQLPRAHGRRAQREADEGLFAPEKPADGDLFGGVNEPDTPLFQRREPAFYSALNRSVEQLPQGKASPEQWSGILDNLRNKGVKQEEIDWSGVKDWLASRSGPIRKADLLDYLRANEVHVQEVMKGGIEAERQFALESATKALVDHLVKNEHFTEAGATEYALDAARGDLSPGQLRMQSPEARDLTQDVLEAYEARQTGDHEKRTKFGSYTLPGGKNYRELLLTLPNARKFDPVREGESYEQWKARNPDAPAPFRSGHFDEPNVLAHVRFDDRTGPNGERILHMAEVQSDWGQKLRRVKQAVSNAVDTDFQGIVDRMKKDGVLVEDCD